MSPGSFGVITIDGINEKIINPAIPQNNPLFASKFLTNPPEEIIKSANAIEVIVIAINDF